MSSVTFGFRERNSETSGRRICVPIGLVALTHKRPDSVSLAVAQLSASSISDKIPTQRSICVGMELGAAATAPCSTYRGVQMKAELLLSDDTGAFGGEMESWEATALLRSFRAVVS